MLRGGTEVSIVTDLLCRARVHALLPYYLCIRRDIFQIKCFKFFRYCIDENDLLFPVRFVGSAHASGSPMRFRGSCTRVFIRIPWRDRNAILSPRI